MAYTFQDFTNERGDIRFVLNAIDVHRGSEAYKTATVADKYDAQENVTIEAFAQSLFTVDGKERRDFTASNYKLASNFFNRLNTQRCMYSLGNGVSFLQADEDPANGDAVKGQLGKNFDHEIKEAAYNALIHGVSFVFWNLDRIHVFKLTEFVPLYDEANGRLRAGIRFWQLDADKPMNVVVYEEDGYTEYLVIDGDAEVLNDKRGYKQVVSYVEADGDEQVVGEENYGSLPIVPMWASRLKQSTLVGMREAIDAYDLVKSGFVNDMADCAEVYWLVSNADGMSDDDLARFRDRLKLLHVGVVNNTDGVSVTPYTQEVPHQARETLLTELRNGIYEDFGALDVHAVAAGATNDHIDAAYQPMDENADDFEYWVGECIVQILALAGIDDRPEFKRNRVSNQAEQVQMVAQEAQWLDLQTILSKLPNLSAEEVAAVMQSQEVIDVAAFAAEEEDEDNPIGA